MIELPPIDIDQVYFFRDCHSVDSVKEILTLNPTIKAVIGDNASLWCFDLEVQTYVMPFWFVSEFYQSDFHRQHYQDFYPTECVFNFCINKKSIPRYLALRAVEFYGLQNYRYTYSGSCYNIRDDRILQEILQADPDQQRFTKDLISQILGPVTILPYFVGIPDVSNESTADKGRIASYGGNLFAWITGLDKIFNSSLVSLITETCPEDYGLASVFTEKTFFALLGLTMPIWVGGYRNAEQFQKMGFDIFEDVIDHSYQYHDSVFFRSLKAVEDNLDLLNLTVDQARDLRQSMLPRLRENRKYFMSQEFLQWFREKMRDWPSSVRQIALEKYPIF